MRLSLNNMRHRADILRKYISDAESELPDKPGQRMRIGASHGKIQYFTVGEGGKLYMIPKNNLETARLLAQRDYDELTMKRAKIELKRLEAMMNVYEHGIAEDVFDKLPAARRSLVTPIMIPDDEFVRQWLAQQYEGPGFMDGAPEFYTESGLRVRSKSEIAIVNKYETLGIPVLYEKPVFLKGWGVAYTDFSALNVRLRKEFKHEHFGMMDDPDYAEENIAKIHAYEKNGYLPGKNFIATFETKSKPFDVRIIDEIAKQFLL